MTRLSINTNIASLTAQRNLTSSTAALQTSFTRLSSGMRINRASDDAAGLSVSSLLEADRRVFTQGIRNLNDGISYLSVAESAVAELTNIMFRIGEIAEQSANGTLSSIQRKPLQDEVTALQNEYNRIINSTKFNGMRLLTGENTRVNLQAGYGEVGGLAVQVGKALVSDAFGLQSAGETIRVSTSSSGGEANAGSTINSVSADGRYVAFRSSATNLIPGVSGTQIYVKDTQTGDLRLASINQDGAQGNNTSSQASISADGRFIAFRSSSTNLIPGVAGDQIYIKDIQTGELRLASSSKNGVQGDNLSQDSLLSGDGRFVAFLSNSTNLITGVTGSQIYIKDLQSGDLRLASSTMDGVQGNSISQQASISSDGRFITFRSSSTNLIPGVTGDQIYIKDLQSGELRLVSSTKDGVQGNNTSQQTSLSANGRFVAFRSNATNLIPGVSGSQIYIKDLQTGDLSLASSTMDGVSGNFTSQNASLSADGRFAVFRSASDNLIPGVGGGQIYRKDLQTREIEVVSRSIDGNIGGGTFSVISADGNKIFFESGSSTLVEGDTNGVGDVFLRDLSKTGINELAGMVVSNQASARTTLTLTKQRLETLNLARAGIGASVSRIETSISNLSSMTQNIASASSQITDTDVAEESARLVANQILQQAGAAVLAQANAQPQIVLRLLSDV